MRYAWMLGLMAMLGMFSDYARAQAARPAALGAQAQQVTVQCTLTRTDTADPPCAQEARRECAGDAKLKQIVSHTAMPVTEGVDQHADALVRYVAIYRCDR